MGDAPDPETWTLTSIHAAHAGFVWATLHRMGVPDADRPDLLQEVFVVVHRRLDSFDRTSRMTTWLYGICLRVVSGWRRHRRRHPETPMDVLPSDPSGEQARSPEEAAASAEAKALVWRALDAMDVDKRAVFVMFELEELGCAEIATMIGIPVGTVYSRLHTARAEFAQTIKTIEGTIQGGRR